MKANKEILNKLTPMNLKEIIENINKLSKTLYDDLNDLSGGVLEIIWTTFQRFSEEKGSEAAASLAYYAFFSIFPTLLAFIVIGSYFFDVNMVQEKLLVLLQGVLPGAESIIIQNIYEVLQLRGTVTVIALIFLIWSGTSVFNIMAININRAFKKAEPTGFFKGRLRGFFMLLGLGFLMLLSFAITTIAEFFAVVDLPFFDWGIRETFLWQIGKFLFPVTLNLLMFWGMYRWVPTIGVSGKAAFLGGLISGLAWEVLNRGFTWFLSSGLIQFGLVYGSLNTIVALLFWIYLTATITLGGAHLTATIHRAARKTPDA